MTLSLGLMATTTAQASLFDRGGGLIYDDDLDITWLADANYAQTSGYDADGRMTWSEAMTWANNLSYYDSVRNVTYIDWRLPTTLQPDAACETQSDGDSYGYNCAGSEMGHLFYIELGGTAGSSILNSSDPDLTLFTNVQSDFYWSGSEYAPIPGAAWLFNFYSGFQPRLLSKNNDFPYAWAVRPGDVAAVPVPAGVWLFGSGLIGLAAVARRRHPLRAVT
jgi:hypothetical protein